MTSQYCDGFCLISTWVSYGCTCVPPSWNPTSTPLPTPSGAGKTGLTSKRMKLEHFLTLYRKIKLIKNLNVRPETIKLLEKNIGRTFSDINHSKILYDPSPRVMKIKINKWDLFKLKSFCTTEEIINKAKRPPPELEKIFANDIISKD